MRFSDDGEMLEASRGNFLFTVFPKFLVTVRLRSIGFQNQSRAMHVFRRLAEGSELPTSVYADFFLVIHPRQSRPYTYYHLLSLPSNLLHWCQLPSRPLRSLDWQLFSYRCCSSPNHWLPSGFLSALCPSTWASSA